MNKTLKWVLIGLAIAAGAFLLALPIFGMMMYRGGMPMMDGWGLRDGLRTSFYHNPHRMMPFMGVFGFLRLLLPLGVLGLAVYGIVALVRGNRRPATAAQVPPAAPAAPAAPLAVDASTEGVCSACGRELHSGGEFCPYCGTKQ